MIVIQFLDQNVFNVLKYVLMAITISYASDTLIEILVAYNTKRGLLKNGWTKPPRLGSNVRFRRGLKIHRRYGSISILLVALAFTAIELSFEFSTGSKPSYSTRKINITVSKEAQNFRDLIAGTPAYIEKMRDSLQRVENICYNLHDNWYHKITLNISQVDFFQALGDGAKCYGNFSDKIRAKKDLKKASYLASSFIETGMWKKNEIRKGREIEPRTKEEGRLGDKDIRVGPLEEFSFLAVNFTQDWYVTRSAKQLSGTRNANKKAFYTADFAVGNNRTIECLALTDDPEEKGNLNVEACLLPLNDNRTLMGMFDDINGTEERQLILSVAYDEINTFRDLRTLKAASWMVQKNSGMHTYRELAKLSVLSSLMVSGVTVEGFRQIVVDIGEDLVTVPTVEVWGIILLASATGIILIGSFLIRSKYRRLPITGNLATSHGVASHWLQRIQEKDDKARFGDEVVLVMKEGDDGPQIVVAEKSEQNVKY